MPSFPFPTLLAGPFAHSRTRKWLVIGLDSEICRTQFLTWNGSRLSLFRLHVDGNGVSDGGGVRICRILNVHIEEEELGILAIGTWSVVGDRRDWPTHQTDAVAGITATGEA